MIIIYDNVSYYSKLLKEDFEHIVKHHKEWSNELKEKQVLVAGNGLEHSGKIIITDAEREDGITLDGVAEIIGRYYVILARSLDDAAEIANDCPSLDVPGTRIEIRPVLETNHKS